MIEMTIIILSLLAGYKMFGDGNDKFSCDNLLLTMWAGVRGTCPL